MAAKRFIKDFPLPCFCGDMVQYKCTYCEKRALGSDPKWDKNWPKKDVNSPKIGAKIVG